MKIFQVVSEPMYGTGTETVKYVAGDSLTQVTKYCADDLESLGMHLKSVAEVLTVTADLRVKETKTEL